MTADDSAAPPRSDTGPGAARPSAAGAAPARTAPPSAATLALAGLAVLLIGIGFGRFAYTALVPALIEAGRLTPSSAGYVAAANFAGYLSGALLSGWVARLGRLSGVVRLSLAATALAYAACAVDLGPVWFALWRFVPGFTGATLMVLVPMAILAGLPAARRPGAVGLMFTGIGLGIIFSGTLVPALARLGVASAWLVLAALTVLLSALTWKLWTSIALPAPAAPPVGAASPRRPGGPGPAVVLVFVAYALDGAGFVPHTVYWVEYVARALGLGFGAGGTHWILFGVGAMAGPLLVGRLAGRFGFGRAFVVALLLKAAAVGLPLVSSATPALVVSSLVVGALTPGTATLAAGLSAEIAGAARQRALWGWMTSGFAATQALSASAFGHLLGATGSYALLFATGAILLAAAAVLAEAGRRLARPARA
ncbi:YbfB/YjiJ family MFS transporter [Prosthecomicrobium sp. N25]|uniref:YbfB/YjiJ family MFS transporter n=1 Tax=Prosthecomicrobium sp. N25 TaxID=3129254 RepID=UPI003076BAAD